MTDASVIEAAGRLTKAQRATLAAIANAEAAGDQEAVSTLKWQSQRYDDVMQLRSAIEIRREASMARFCPHCASQGPA